MDKHISLSPCPFCGMGLTLDIDEEGGVAILHSLKGEKNCWFPSIVEIEMPVKTTLKEMVEILNRRPIQESFEHALVGASLVAAARLQDKCFEIQDLNADLARRDEELALTEKKLCNIDRSARAEIARRDERIAELEAELAHIKGKKETVFEVMSNTIARRDEIITRLKEDGDNLYMALDLSGATKKWAIEKHRALMKELE